MPRKRAEIIPFGPATAWTPHFAKYDPAHCQTVRDLAQQGKFPESWCAHIGCAMSTLYRWANEHPEFEEAVHIAWHLLHDYWTEYAVKNMGNTDLRSSVLLEVLRKRFPSTYGNAPCNTYEHFRDRDRAVVTPELEEPADVAEPEEPPFDFTTADEAAVAARIEILEKRRRGE